MDEAKFKLLRDHLLKFEDQLSTDKPKVEGMIEKKQRDLKALESKFTNEINKTKQLRKETDTKINKYEDEKTYAIKVELAKNKKSREEQEEKYAAEIGNEVQML